MLKEEKIIKAIDMSAEGNPHYDCSFYVKVKAGDFNDLVKELDNIVTGASDSKYEDMMIMIEKYNASIIKEEDVFTIIEW